MTQKSYTLAAVLISSFICPFMASAMTVAVPAIAVEFGVPAVQMSWLLTAFLLGSACVLLPFGRLADLRGRKRVFLWGLSGVFVTSLLCGASVSAEMLIFVRFLQGIVISMIFSTGIAILVSSHRPEERGKVLGISVSFTYAGISTGPFLGGAIAEFFGWRMIFFVTAVVVFASWYLGSKVVDEWYGEKGGQMDLRGSFFYAVSMLCILYGISVFETQPLAVWIVVVGAVFGAVFLWEQMASEHPLIQLSLFLNVTFSMSNLAALLHYSATFAISFLLSLYLELLHGFTESQAGAVLLLQPLMMAALSAWAGSLSDKVQPRIVASFGMGLTTMGLAFLSGIGMATPVWQVGIILVLIGIGFAFFSSPNSNAIMGAVHPSQMGVATSIFSVMRVLGQGMSMAMVTLLLNRYVLSATGGGYLASLEAGIQQIFFLFTFICLAGTAISAMRGKGE